MQPWACECDSFNDCGLELQLNKEALQLINEFTDHYVISNKCPNGPNDTDVFVKEFAGYKIYKEANSQKRGWLAKPKVS